MIWKSNNHDYDNDENKKNNNVICIPSNPDKTIQTQIESTVLSTHHRRSCCCQVEIYLQSDRSSLCYSLDCDGSYKDEGGDEFYIRYEEHVLLTGGENGVDGELEQRRKILTQAVALITDNLDGSYRLDFSTTPTHPHIHILSKKNQRNAKDDDYKDKDDDNYEGIDNCGNSVCNDYGNGNAENDEEGKNISIIRTITVYFEYTNKIGCIPPPLKKNWLNGGYSHKCYKIDLTCHQCQHPPYIVEFVPPSPKIVDLSKFDQVYAFGDSTFCQLLRQRPNKKGKYYFQPNLKIIGDRVRMGLNSETVNPLIDLLIMNEEADKNLSNGTDQKEKALILGSGLWDILNANDSVQGLDFLDHCNACRKYINLLKQRYPSVSLIWKSPMAVHIHWVDLQRVTENDRETATLFGINRIKYMSASRSQNLYKLQLKLMHELGIPVIDLYKATYLSSDCLYPSDGRHYKPDLNRKMIGWYYSQQNKNTKDIKKSYFDQIC